MAEANTAPFYINVEGEVTGEKFPGDFEVKKRLTHADNLRKDQVRRQLLGGQSGEPSARAASIALILSELAVRIVSAPKWWTESEGGLKLEDDDVIGKVYDEAMRIEREAAEARKKRAEKAVEEMRAEAAKKKAESDKPIEG